MNYDSKPEDYYSHVRKDLVDYLPLAQISALLDVGCAQGGFGAYIKSRKSDIEVWGIEPQESAYQKAKDQLDHAIHAFFTPELKLEKTFDCIVFNDVLEHIEDPWEALKHAKTLLNPGGYIFASIPNIGHYSILWDLVMNNKFEYTADGILDKTHLRFFTKSGVQSLFEQAGLQVSILQGINPNYGRKYKLLNLLFLNRLKEAKFKQFAVLARKEK